MYKKIKKIENVQEYDPLTGGYTYKKDKKDKDEIACLEWGEIEGFWDIMSYNDLDIIKKSSGGATAIYKNCELVKEIQDAYWFSYMSDKGFIFPYEKRFSKALDSYTSFFNIIDLNTFEEILTDSVPYCLEYTKGVIIGFCQITYKIVRLNKDTSIVWEYDLKKELPKFEYYEYEDDSIRKMVGIVGSKLWVKTKAGRLLALDIETGEVLKVLSNDEGDKKYGYEFYPLADIFSKDGDDDYLYSLGLAFAKIDAHTMEVVETYDTENFEDDELLSGFESKLHMMHHE